MSPSSRILVVGVACVDIYPDVLTPSPPGSPEKLSQGSLPWHDQRVVISGIWETPGGNAANVALALAWNRVPTDLVAPIAHDRHGSLLERRFLEAGLAFDSAVCRREDPDRNTGYSCVMLDGSGEPAFVHYPGAGLDLDVAWLERALARGSYRASSYSFLHVAGLGLLPAFETPEELARGAAWVEDLRGRHPGLLVSMDVNHVRGWSGRDWARFAPLLRQADLLMPNHLEAAQMIRGRAGAPPEPMRARYLQEICSSERGRPWVIVKRGAAGGTVLDPQGVETEYDPVPCEVADRTGAGDSFAAGLLAGLHGGKRVPEAARQGALWASRCVERRGSTSWARPAVRWADGAL